MHRNFVALTVLLLASALQAGDVHPQLISPTNRVATLATAGNAEWTALRNRCDAGLNTLVIPEYAGWGWREAIEEYALAYNVAKALNDATRTLNYGRKALALMKVSARHHNYGSPDNAEYVGRTNGSTTQFILPRAPVGAVTVFLTPLTIRNFTYNGVTQALPEWERIVAIGNTAAANADYPQADWRFSYRDGFDVFTLRWLTGNHPANGATYYVASAGDSGTTVAGANYSVSGSTLTFNTAPAAGQCVYVRFMGANYEQTGNYLGGRNSVQPDGPGYQMRTFNVGLAYGYDLIYDFAEFTPALKQEFYTVLNEQIDWYATYGYENDGDLGNYFIRGYLTGTMFTAYATANENPRGAEFKTRAGTLLQRTFNALNEDLPGGYGPQGQYTNGVTTDCLQLLTLWKQLTGEDRLAQLAWTQNSVRAVIHGTKPNRVTFYDGGDWTDLPAVPLFDAMKSYLQYLPNDPLAPFARQLLQDGGQSVPPGTISDYKTSFPLSYCAEQSGPVYARSDWSTGAVWMSFAAGPELYDHQHRDQGHITIQCGADYLLVNSGGYGLMDTEYHNTVLFDDRGEGDISNYPPGQGAWGFDRVHIIKHADGGDYTYSQADYGAAYAAAHDGTRNSVTQAIRSVVYLRPGLMIVHDQAQTANANVRKIFNLNFSGPLTQNGAVFSMTKGASKLFMRSVLPANPNPTFGTVTEYGTTSHKYQVTETGATQSNFLHVFEAGATSVGAATPATLVATADNLGQGVELTTGGFNRVVLFARKDREIPATSISYAFANSGAQRHLVTDVHPEANHRVLITSGAATVFDQNILSSPEGTLSIAFTAAAGGQVSISRGATPMVTLTAPTNGATYVSPVNIAMAANASDSDGTIARVEFYSNGSKLGEDVSAPFAFTWNNAPGGTQRITAKAIDNSGNATVSATATVTVNGPPNTNPAITSGATATPNPAVAGTVVAFAAAASDANGDVLSYAWDFGDGSSGFDTATTHTYATAGVYGATVVARDGRGGSATSSVLVQILPDPNGGGGGGGDGGGGGGGGNGNTPLPMSVTKLQASLNFKGGGKDSVALRGSVANLPALFETTGLSVVLDAGGALSTFTLDAKGRGKSTDGLFALKLKRKRNKATKKVEFAGGDGPFQAALKKGTWSDDWADEGAQSTTTKNAPLTMNVTLTLGGTVYAATVDALYSAKAGASGKIKK